MKKIILYVDGPRILSKRIFCILLIFPIIGLMLIFKINLALIITSIIISLALFIFSLTAINSGDAIIIQNNSIYSWNKVVKSRIKKQIDISTIERIKIIDPFVVIKLQSKYEKEYYFQKNQKNALFCFLNKEQIQILIK